MAIIATRRLKFKGQWHQPGEELDKPTRLIRTDRMGNMKFDKNGNPDVYETTTAPNASELAEMKERDLVEEVERLTEDEQRALAKHRQKLGQAREALATAERAMEEAETQEDKAKAKKALEQAQESLNKLSN